MAVPKGNDIGEKEKNLEKRQRLKKLKGWGDRPASRIKRSRNR